MSKYSKLADSLSRVRHVGCQEDCWEAAAALRELEAERDRLLEALKDANSLCRSAYQVASRIAVEHGTVTLQTNFGALADKLSESLKRQHAALQEGT